MLHIRSAAPSDAPAIAAIILPVIREGATYALDPCMAEADAITYWMGDDRQCFVAEEDGAILGTYYLRANQAGGGGHVCNCGYMTAAQARGRGVARAMSAHSIEQGRQARFRAMQFNFVVASNLRAVHLWQAMRFAIVGRLPGAFRQPDGAYVDALVMHRTLLDEAG